MRMNLSELTVPTSETKNPLDELVPKYGANKAEADDLKKIVDAQNKQIKELMAEADIESYEAGGYVASVSTTEKSKFNEAKLLNVIKGNKELAEQVIKTQEYVDMDMLENILYTGKVSKDMLLELDKCKETSAVVTLRIKKAKKKKGE